MLHKMFSSTGFCEFQLAQIAAWLIILLSYMTVTVAAISEYSSTDPGTEEQNNSTKAGNNPWATSCPDMCMCYMARSPAHLLEYNTNHISQKLFTVNCSNKSLKVVPETLPNKTQVLILSFNSITTWTRISNCENLIFLDVSNNSISSIVSNAFAQCRKLIFVSFKNNYLTLLPHGIFDLLYQVHSLDLSGNLLTNLSAEIFRSLTYMKTLQLTSNMIKNINRSWFRNLLGLRELDLSYNQLLAIKKEDFTGLDDLSLLNLSHNKIRTIDNQAFSALNNLLIMDLSGNSLQFVPTLPLLSTQRLKKVSLNGNPIIKLHPGDFRNLSVTALSVSYMPNLHTVEQSAFQDIQNLQSVELHDNPKLMFIDPGAFQRVPRLTSLYLHNNRLPVLSPKLLLYAPTVEEIHFYHNPIRCDCNSYWISKLLNEVKLNNISKPYFNGSASLMCDFPLNLTGEHLEDVNVTQFNRVCSPTTIPLFHENYTMDLGEELRLECHSYGVPEPVLSWILPNGSEVDTNIRGDKFEIRDKCVLIVRYLTTKDSGVYACKASNGVGYDISSVRINVTNKPVRLVLFSTGYDYISLSWNGTKHSSFISDYQLHYREIKGNYSQQIKNNQIKYRVIPLRPQYKSYTVTMLSPNTLYEFCIVYLYDTEYYKVDCEIYRTKRTAEYQSAVRKIISEKIIAGMCTALGLIMAIACMVTLVKKFRLHKEYETPYASDDMESVNIPLQNVYQPLSTPLCSSKTSLLSLHTSKSRFDEY